MTDILKDSTTYQLNHKNRTDGLSLLKDSGYLLLWVDKFHLCQGVRSWIADADLNLVNMIVWDKGRIGMGVSYTKKMRISYDIAEKAYQSERVLDRPLHS